MNRRIDPMKTATVALAVIWVALVTCPRPSEAACNIIPKAPPSGSPPSFNLKLPAGSAPKLPYKGALGSIDRVYLLSDAPSVAVGADRTCVSAPQAETEALPLLQTDDELVAALFYPRGRKTFVRVFSQATHDELAAEHAALKFDLLPDYIDGPLVRVPSPGTPTILLPLAHPLGLPAAMEVESNALTPDYSVRVFVARKPNTARALADLFNVAARADCESECSSLLAGGAEVCIDGIYRREADEHDATKFSYVPDIVPCNVQAPDPLPINVFIDQCRDAEGNPNDLPHCKDHPDALKYWTDNCGGVHIAFDWKEIKGTDDTHRVVAGRSGAGRRGLAHKQRVELPGPEFLGSTPHGNPQGDAPGVDWRRPDIELWEPTGHGEEIGLRGTVDENDSIVHIYPRIPVDQICEGSPLEACFGLDRNADGEVPDTCACADNHTAPCTCKTASQQVLFVCTGGSQRIEGRPCTRQKHCIDQNKSGTCTGRPFCYLPGSVWGQSPPAQPGGTCFNDENCKLAGGAKSQCGYLLFDFATNRTPPLDFDIETSSKKERGTCEPGNEPCSNGGSGKPPACGSGKHCRGYALEAQGKK